MPKKQTSKLPTAFQQWVDARKSHGLSHAQIQMARELGFQPKSLRKIDDSAHKPWKAPLGTYIEGLYVKKFGRGRPATVLTIEEMANKAKEKKAGSKQATDPPQNSQPPDPDAADSGNEHGAGASTQHAANFF